MKLTMYLRHNCGQVIYCMKDQFLPIKMRCDVELWNELVCVKRRSNRIIINWWTLKVRHSAHVTQILVAYTSVSASPIYPWTYHIPLQSIVYPRDNEVHSRTIQRCSIRAVKVNQSHHQRIYIQHSLWSLHQQTHLSVSIFCVLHFNAYWCISLYLTIGEAFNNRECTGCVCFKPMGCISNLTTHSEESSLEITCGWGIGETFPWSCRAQRSPTTWYCLQGAVGPARRYSSAVFTEWWCLVEVLTHSRV